MVSKDDQAPSNTTPFNTTAKHTPPPAPAKEGKKGKNLKASNVRRVKAEDVVPGSPERRLTIGKFDESELTVDQRNYLREFENKANEAHLRFLDRLNSYTNNLATDQGRQTSKLTEASVDLHRMLATSDSNLDLAIQARLQIIADALTASVEFWDAQVATLKAMGQQTRLPLPTAVRPA